MATMQKAFARAKDIITDPFASKRKLTETPEIMTPLFEANLMPREKLVSKAILGQGQVCF